jgi:hypothetical protein
MFDNTIKAVKITYLPNNFFVLISSNNCRQSMKSLVDIAKTILGIRLLAQQETLVDVYEYDLPDGQEYPHELMKYRKAITGIK